MDEPIDARAQPPATVAATEAPSAGALGPPTREYRAQLTFAIAAAFLLFALLIVLANAGSVVGSVGGTLLAALLGIGTSGFEAWGLSKGRDWARYAMGPMLWIFVAAGAFLFLVAITRNTIHIPIGGILAAWALFARPSADLGPLPGSSTEGLLLVIGTIVSALIQFI